MELNELQDAIVDGLGPGCQRLAARHPEFVERVLRRLVLRVPNSPHAELFDLGEREEFCAEIGVDSVESPAKVVDSVWLFLLLSYLLPMLIRCFLRWLNESQAHRDSAVGLRNRLKEGVAAPQKRDPFWRLLLGIVSAVAVVAVVCIANAAESAAPKPPREVDLCKDLIPVLTKQRGGKWHVEHRLWDETRVDLISDEYAVEVDFPEKWAECIGQALYYGHVTDRQPVCLLLVASPADDHFVYRCQTVCEAHDILLWIHRVNVDGKLAK